MAEPSNGSQRRRALITGTTAGIGEELARIFAVNGYDLILVARRKDKLEAQARELEELGVSVRVIPADLADPAAPEKIYSECLKEQLHVDVLVNNAGLGTYGKFHEVDLHKNMAMIQVNVNALTQLTGEFVVGMVERGWGRILNVASTAAFQPGPLMACYYASKAYVLSFSEAIANELSGTGVKVTALCPGPTKSEFQRAAQMEKSRLVSGLVPMMSSREVAEAGYRALMAGQTIVIPGVANWMGVQSVRFTPRSIVPRIIRFVQDAS